MVINTSFSMRYADSRNEDDSRRTCGYYIDMPGENADSSFPMEPVRIKGFATYFKGYMGVGSIVTAALPIPVTSLELIPFR